AASVPRTVRIIRDKRASGSMPAMRLLLVTRQRPGHMLADQCRGIVPARPQGGEDSRRRRRIAQRDGDVAQPSLVADAADRRTLEARVELVLGPGEKVHQRRIVEALAGGEVGA